VEELFHMSITVYSWLHISGWHLPVLTTTILLALCSAWTQGTTCKLFPAELLSC